MEKYWARGEDCPVVVSAGHDPSLFFAAGLENPHGVSEFEVAGGLKGEPIQVVKSQITGLPIPATGEIVIEGKLPPNEMRDEGPVSGSLLLPEGRRVRLRIGRTSPDYELHCDRWSLQCRYRDRGEASRPPPPTPPGIRIRTKAVRLVRQLLVQ
ncbi:MAG: UbiD family decarboxylase [Acidobacteria bacterium]|nr:UbiD family decarboxylase [Acidobacteriota bacterium]